MIITLLTDFGDMYPASMKGVILSIDPNANIVDISHSVLRHNVRAGAFMLMACARYFPSGTVHIAVVDPGVGTKRRAIAINAVPKDHGNHYFIGPDNGILIPAAKSVGKFEVYEITNKKLFNQDVSSTFHGRDIFAPVGAHISKGMDIADVGRRISDFVDLDFGKGKKMGNAVEGRVIFIDDFGNIVTNISSDLISFQPGDIMEIDKKSAVFQRSYGFCKHGEPLALIGSHGFLELAENQGSAANFFKKKQGDEIIIIRYP
ncbi:MAG: S-adenosyl-l-methionine hydroxide adenosyltransferase family protein [Candidatus Methanoperedens sp.]|nr:S-adenosyl-l-methionine hydroxide adenosyltransferase family protein [Candidatus Methanoperedens sp.]